MPRNARIDIPGLLHHVIVRGIEKRPIFHDDQDREEFLTRFLALLQETGTQCARPCSTTISISWCGPIRARLPLSWATADRLCRFFQPAPQPGGPSLSEPLQVNSLRYRLVSPRIGEVYSSEPDSRMAGRLPRWPRWVSLVRAYRTCRTICQGSYRAGSHPGLFLTTQTAGPATLQRLFSRWPQGRQVRVTKSLPGRQAFEPGIEPSFVRERGFR